MYLRNPLSLIVTVFLSPLLTALLIPWNYSAPSPPEGFYTRIGYSATSLDSLGVYASAIEAVFEWSGAAWDSLALGEGTVHIPTLGVSLDYDSMPFAGSRTYLKWSHVFLGIAASVTEMTLHDLFRELSAGLYTERGWVGVVRFEPTVPAPNTIGDANSTSKPSNSSFEPLFQVQGKDSGRAVDPKQPKLGLTWKFDTQAQEVQSLEILTTIIDAMIYAASETDVMRHQQIYGHSATKLYEISIESVQPLWTKWFLVKALRLLAHVFIKERRWQAMDFSMTWSGHEVARGYLWETIQDHSSRSTEMATSK
ncbi:MAG: hypothetical protein Q9195_003531 [Heterodermia aff. obscurata]